MWKARWFVLALASGLVVGAVQAQTLSVQEDFVADPAARGWLVHGHTNLFYWNPTNQNLEVAWDSSLSNSYFCHPLGATLTMEDDFSVAFDLELHEAAIGGYGFELALGLLNLADATQPGFLRGTGADSPNLVEFDYFPDPEGELWWGASVTTMMVDWVGTDSSHWSLGGFAGMELAAHNLYHVELVYAADTRTLRTTITNLTLGGIAVGPVPEAYLPPTFLGFRVDHIAIASYSDANSWGSLWARGTVDNLGVAGTARAIGRVQGGWGAGGVWQARFFSRADWRYTLERTTDFQSWTPVSATRQGVEGDLVLQDAEPPAAAAFYRVRAEQP